MSMFKLSANCSTITEEPPELVDAEVVKRGVIEEAQSSVCLAETDEVSHLRARNDRGRRLVTHLVPLTGLTRATRRVRGSGGRTGRLDHHDSYGTLVTKIPAFGPA